MTDDCELPADGQMLTEIGQRLVRLVRDNYGRGPLHAKAYGIDNMIVCTLRSGLIPLERAMLESGEPGRALNLRRGFQQLMRPRYAAAVEELTGCHVMAVLSDASLEPDMMIEIFVLDRPPA